MIANGLFIVLAILQSNASVPKEEIATLRRALAYMDSFDGALSNEQAARINARYALDLRRVTGRAIRELLDRSGSEAERASCLSYFGRQKADAIGGVYLARLAQGDRQRRVRNVAAYALQSASREGTLTKDLPGVSSVAAQTVREIGGDARLAPLASLLCRIGGASGIKTVENSLAPPNRLASIRAAAQSLSETKRADKEALRRAAQEYRRLAEHLDDLADSVVK